MTDSRDRLNHLMADDAEEIVELAVEMAGNRLSPARAAEVQARLANDEHFRAIAQPVLDSYSPKPLAPERLSRAWDDFRSRVGLTPAVDNDLTDFEARVRSRQTRVSTWLLRVAVIMFLLLMLPIGFLVYADRTAYEVRVADLNVRSEVRLPDGSTVNLTPGTKIKYLKDLHVRQYRRVLLDGEATFVVSGKYVAPFVVQTEVAIVTAIGTRFTVHGFPDEPLTDVHVHEGRVTIQPLDAESRAVGKLIVVQQGVRLRVTRAGVVADAEMTDPYPAGAR